MQDLSNFKIPRNTATDEGTEVSVPSDSHYVDIFVTASLHAPKPKRPSERA